MPRSQAHTGELAHDVTFLIGHRRATVDRDRISAMFSLYSLPATYNVVQGLIPASALQLTTLASSSNHRVVQAIRVVDLLVGHDSFWAERAAIMWKVAGFDANDLALLHRDMRHSDGQLDRFNKLVRRNAQSDD